MSARPRQKKDSVKKQRLRLWLKLLKAQSAIEGEVRGRLRDEYQSTLPRFDVMSALARFPDGLKMSEISALLKVSNGNVTGIVDRLVQDGLALRVAVPEDRRAQKVCMTPAGQEAFTELAEAHSGWINDMLSNLKQSDVAELTALMDGVIDHLEANGKSTRA